MSHSREASKQASLQTGKEKSLQASKQLRMTVGNLKGGTGKSTSSVYLALALAQRGDRVLLVCADDTNATTYSWVEMAGEDWPANVIVQRWPTLHLARLVRDSEGTFDHLVIDTGRDATILRNALTVTDLFLVPIAPSIAEIARLQDTLDCAAEVGAQKDLELAILLTRGGTNTRVLRDVRKHLVEDRQLPVISTFIPSSVRYYDAMGDTRTSPHYGPVLTEILEMMGER